MLRIVLLHALLLAAIFCVKKVNLGNNLNASSYLSRLDEVIFLDKEIGFLPSQQREFGFLSKTNGELSMMILLDSSEKILTADSYNIVITNTQHVLKYFDCGSKKLAINKLNDQDQFQSILSHMFMNEKLYILTDQDLRVYENSSSYKVLLKKPEPTSGLQEVFFDALYLVSQSAEKSYTLVSFIQNEEGKIMEVCFRKFVDQVMNENHICLNIEGEKLYDVQKSSQHILVGLGEETLILDSRYKLVKRVQGTIQQTNANYLNMGKSSFNIMKEATDEVLTAVDGQNGNVYKIIPKKTSFEVFSDGEVKKVGELLRQDGEEISNFWVTSQKETEIVEMVCQWGNLDITYHTISGGKLTELWRIKGKPQ